MGPYFLRACFSQVVRAFLLCLCFSLCKQTPSMPTTIVAQDGAVIEQTTPIAITGCGEVKSNIVKKLSRAQLLAKALKACRTKHKHNKKARTTCEKQARKKYGPIKKTAKKAARKASHHGRA